LGAIEGENRQNVGKKAVLLYHNSAALSMIELVDNKEFICNIFAEAKGVTYGGFSELFSGISSWTRRRNQDGLSPFLPFCPANCQELLTMPLCHTIID
jgi:hypothetical protein